MLHAPACVRHPVISDISVLQERLCRRSTLSEVLKTPGPGSRGNSNYPIPGLGGIFSENVGTSSPL